MQQVQTQAALVCVIQRLKRNSFSKASPQQSSLLLTETSQFCGALIVWGTTRVKKLISVPSLCWKTRTGTCFPEAACTTFSHSSPDEQSSDTAKTTTVCQWLPIINSFCLWLGNCISTGFYLTYSKPDSCAPQPQTALFKDRRAQAVRTAEHSTL